MYEGNMDGLELLKNESQHLKMKNQLLMPVYSQIVSLVKHIKNTDLNKLKNEYKTALVIAKKHNYDQK